MIVGLFTDTYLPDVNGVVSSVDTLRLALENDGHEVYVICPKPAFDRAELNDHVLRLPGIQVKFLYGYTLTSPWHRKALKIIEGLNLDIIHVHTEFGVGLFARSVARKLNIPIVATYHTFYEDYTHYINPMNSRTADQVARKTIISLSRYFCDSVEGVIAPTEKTKKRLEEYGVKTKVSIVPTGLDLEMFEDRSDIVSEPFSDDIFKLVFVGRLAEEKRVDFILEGLAEMLKRGMKVGLLIVGDGPDSDKLMQKCIDLRITESVIFTGKIIHSNIAPYYRYADAFISASLTETQGMTFIEAMATGTPVLACDDVALNEVLVDGVNGYYFHTIEQLCEKVSMLVDRKPEEKKKMSSECISSADRYSLNNFARNAEQVYADTMLDYGFPYVINDVRLDGDYVKIKVVDKESETSFRCLALDYFDLGYRVGQGIGEKDFEKLNKLHAYSYAYQKCLKKIAYKDQSVQEISDFLDKQNNLDSEMKKQIMDNLLKQGFLDDERLIQNAFEYEQTKLNGRKKIAYELSRRGLNEELISRYSQMVDDEKEIERGVAKAQQLLKSLNGRSYRETMQMLKNKLAATGYEKDAVNRIMERCDIQKDEEQEKDSLDTAFERVLRRYSHKYNGHILRQKVYTYLVGKGFNSSEINNKLNSMEDGEYEDQ